MARKLSKQVLLSTSAVTYEGAAAYDYSKSEPLTHLTFTMGSALFTDGFYESEQQQVRRYVDALLGAYAVEPKFAWQYAAWMRDPVKGKGNRIQGSLAPAILDAAVDESATTEEYVAKCLSHRPDDVTAFMRHYERLSLGRPSRAARRGMARALASFDEYQLMKYAEQKSRDVRLCDAIMFVRDELEALGAAGRLAHAVGRYLHASTRDRADLVDELPLTAARRSLWRRDADFARSPHFVDALRAARVTWEQVMAKFGSSTTVPTKANRAVWKALLQIDGLLGDTAFMRNLRNMVQAGVSMAQLRNEARRRRFARLWPHQVYAGYLAASEAEVVFETIFARMIEKLPPGRHLGIGDASGSMGVRVGGQRGSLTCMDVAFCLVGLMSETSGLGASFCDDSFSSYSGGSYLSMVERPRDDSALAFAKSPALRRGWGGTQVFGAVMELIDWLRARPYVEPPDCLWFFSDMQFHPGAGASRSVPSGLMEEARRRGIEHNVPPLELALRLYRSMFGPVDVVLWNLAAYSPTPVPADMEGVLLVSGFDSNTLRRVAEWREGACRSSGPVRDNQDAVLDHIRTY